MPVVDERGALLGIVTTEDASDAIEDDVLEADKTKTTVLKALCITCRVGILFLALYTPWS